MAAIGLSYEVISIAGMARSYRGSIFLVPSPEPAELEPSALQE